MELSAFEGYIVHARMESINRIWPFAQFTSHISFLTTSPSLLYFVTGKSCFLFMKTMCVGAAREGICARKRSPARNRLDICHVISLNSLQHNISVELWL